MIAKNRPEWLPWTACRGLRRLVAAFMVRRLVAKLRHPLGVNLPQSKRVASRFGKVVWRSCPLPRRQVAQHRRLRQVSALNGLRQGIDDSSSCLCQRRCVLQPKVGRMPNGTRPALGIASHHPSNRRTIAARSFFCNACSHTRSTRQPVAANVRFTNRSRFWFAFRFCSPNPSGKTPRQSLGMFNHGRSCWLDHLHPESCVPPSQQYGLYCSPSFGRWSWLESCWLRV